MYVPVCESVCVRAAYIEYHYATESPYYRLDPARFPDVKGMAAQVKELTGGGVYPYLLCVS